MTRIKATWLLLMLARIAPVGAETLLRSDFEDGGAAPWRAQGSASVTVTRYAGNASLRLDSGATAAVTLSTQGYTDVSVTLALAGRALGHGGRCSVEASVDHGQHWLAIHELRAGDDDGVTLHRGGRSLVDLADQAELVVRIRTRAHGDEARCWADDIDVSGRRTGPPAASPGQTAAWGNRAARLFDGSARGPWPMGAFAVAVDAVAPGQPLQGRLRLGSARAGEFAVRKDGYALATADNGRATSLPAATLELVSDGTTLLPLHRGTQVGEHPVWDWVFEPGRVWADPADPDLTHAVMPFALEERNANCLHNGVLTFAIDGRGAVSAVAFEIASETCAYFQFDQWGVLGADFQRVELPAAAAALQARRRELGARLPVRPIEQLAIDHPGAGPTRFGAPEEIDPAAMTAYGVVVDGVHYVGACATRAGPVLDCDELALPSYSLAKSLVAGLAMMRMERLYPGTADQLLSDLVPECDAREWRGVQLRHLLDMSTGHYRSALNQVDEDAADLLPFFNAEGHATRLAFACGHYPRKADPGRRWVYHTSDSYLLGTALARAYRRHAGPAGDFYRDLLVRDVFAPLDLNPALAETRRTRDPQLQPFTGYGLTLHRDDIARLAQFILGSAEAADAGAILDPALLQQALQRDPGRRGFEAPDADFRYQHGFWAWNARHALGCRQDAWIPYLSGYGGIVVALFPNGVIYYYVSDGGVFRWAQAAREANQLRPFCEVNRP